MATKLDVSSTTVVKLFDSNSYGTFTSKRRNDTTKRCVSLLENQEEVLQVLNIAAGALSRDCEDFLKNIISQLLRANVSSQQLSQLDFSSIRMRDTFNQDISSQITDLLCDINNAQIEDS